jgi:hypothetical protein
VYDALSLVMPRRVTLQTDPQSMKTTVVNDFIACLIGGALGGVFLPLYLLTAGLVAHRISLTDDDLTGGLVYFGLLGLCAGLIVAICVGLPALVLLKCMKWDRPIVMIVFGACVATIFEFRFLHESPRNWHHILLAASLGASCGAATSFLRNLGQRLDS